MPKSIENKPLPHNPTSDPEMQAWIDEVREYKNHPPQDPVQIAPRGGWPHATYPRTAPATYIPQDALNIPPPIVDNCTCSICNAARRRREAEELDRYRRAFEHAARQEERRERAEAEERQRQEFRDILYRRRAAQRNQPRNRDGSLRDTRPTANNLIEHIARSLGLSRREFGIEYVPDNFYQIRDPVGNYHRVDRFDLEDGRGRGRETVDRLVAQIRDSLQRYRNPPRRRETVAEGARRINDAPIEWVEYNHRDHYPARDPGPLPPNQQIPIQTNTFVAEPVSAPMTPAQEAEAERILADMRRMLEATVTEAAPTPERPTAITATELRAQMEQLERRIEQQIGRQPRPRLNFDFFPRYFRDENI